VSLCEFPCANLGDCPNLETICVSGACQPNLCGASANNGTLDSTCNVVGSNDGSCLPATVDGQNIGLCSQEGPEDAGCSPSATRTTIATACQAGEVCVASFGDSCGVLCDPFAFEPCGVGVPCVTPQGADARLGVCRPAGTTTSSSSGTTGTGTTTSSSSGSSTGGTTSGCSTAISPGEFQTCQTIADCGCPMDCVSDPAAGGQVCEYECTQTSDCPDLVTICQNGVCAVNQCGGATGNGSFNGTCNVEGTNDGTCEPLTLDGGFSSIGYCYQAGDATSSCDPSASRVNAASQICPPGFLCFGGVETFGGTCNQLCTPPGGQCPGGQFCSNIVNEPDLGICITGL
jgi:hypothetical protein